MGTVAEAVVKVRPGAFSMWMFVEMEARPKSSIRRRSEGVK